MTRVHWLAVMAGVVLFAAAGAAMIPARAAGLWPAHGRCLDLGDALDVDARPGENLDDGGEPARPILS
jgi:hypothetical protein